MNQLITNGTEIKQKIISEINNSKQCVYLAMAFFTDRDIAYSLIAAKNRNVTVDVILSSNIQNEKVREMLETANVSVHAFETGDNRGIMHHKFCLIDNRISINGSYNYSINASSNNVENIQVSEDLSLHSQFLTEFERLKFNIDNRIAVNETPTTPDSVVQIQQVQPTNIIDTFSQRLHSLVYTAAQIDPEEFNRKGYETSKEHKGNISIFTAEYNTIKERINTYATDEGLGNVRNKLTADISTAFDSTTTNLETEKLHKTTVEKGNNDLEKRQISDKLVELRQQKSILETGNQNTGERGLLQINKEIEKNKLERKALDQSLIVKKFWNVGTILISILLIALVFYLSLFFASAMYKLFFEGNIIRNSLEAGITPGLPQLVNANAVVTIFKQQGTLFGIIAAIFFLFPVLLSNIKLFGSKNKWLNGILFWAGLLIFDIVVAAMVAFNTDEIKSLLKGTESQLKFWEVVGHGEFWLMFVFGMMPLVITHYAIDFLYNAYKNSQRDVVDAEKNRKIQFLDLEMIELNSEKESLNHKMKEKEEAINDKNNKILNLETEINNRINQIDNESRELQKRIKAIYDEFSARITSGIIFTDVILSSVVTAYKSGFIEFLPEYYASDVVANKVIEIEQATRITI